MAFVVDENTGNIQLIQGDSGRYILEDLPTDKTDYVIYFQAQDENRNYVGEPIYVACNGADTVTFVFTGNYTDAFTVRRGEDSQDYYFAFKLCSESANIEQTLQLGSKGISDLNVMTVYPKRVEGI